MEFLTAAKLNDYGKWNIVPFEELLIGDIFQLFEPDGKLVPSEGHQAHVVTKAPEPVADQPGNYILSGEPFHDPSMGCTC